jgi:hypothetical protein
MPNAGPHPHTPTHHTHPQCNPHPAHPNQGTHPRRHTPARTPRHTAPTPPKHTHPQCASSPHRPHTATHPHPTSCPHCSTNPTPAHTPAHTHQCHPSSSVQEQDFHGTCGEHQEQARGARLFSPGHSFAAQGNSAVAPPIKKKSNKTLPGSPPAVSCPPRCRHLSAHTRFWNIDQIPFRRSVFIKSRKEAVKQCKE